MSSSGPLTRADVESCCRVLAVLGANPELYLSDEFQCVRKSVLPLFQQHQQEISAKEELRKKKTRESQERDRIRNQDKTFFRQNQLRSDRIKKLEGTWTM
jgi:hypothetical protein